MSDISWETPENWKKEEAPDQSEPDIESVAALMGALPIQLNGHVMHGFQFDGHGLKDLEGMYVEKVVVIPYKLVNIVAIPMKIVHVPVEPEPPPEGSLPIPEIL